jgi:hypothetical protein
MWAFIVRKNFTCHEDYKDNYVGMDEGVAEKLNFLLQLPSVSDCLKLFYSNLLELRSFDEILVVVMEYSMLHIYSP